MLRGQIRENYYEIWNLEFYRVSTGQWAGKLSQYSD
jgi:hypothetical protein